MTEGPWVVFGDEIYGADGSRIAEAVKKCDQPAMVVVPDLIRALRIATSAALLNGVDQWSLRAPLALLEKFPEDQR